MAYNQLMAMMKYGQRPKTPSTPMVTTATQMPVEPEDDMKKAQLAQKMVQEVVETNGQVSSQPGFMDRVKGFFGSEENMLKLAELAYGFSQRPEMAQGPRDRLNQIRQQHEAARASQAAKQTQNRTVQVLRQQGFNKEADAVEAGMLSPKEAAKLIFNKKPTEQWETGTAEQLGLPGGEPNTLYKRELNTRDVKRIGGGGTNVRTEVNMPDTSPKDGQLYEFDKTKGIAYVYDSTQPSGIRAENAPMGPADRGIKEDQKREKEKIDYENQQDDFVISEVDKAINMLESDGLFDFPEAGVVAEFGRSEMFGPLRNQEAVDYAGHVKSIHASIAFDRLQKMRDFSKTGAALGNVTERELQLLMSTKGALFTDMSKEAQLETLKAYRKVLTNPYYTGEKEIPNLTTQSTPEGLSNQFQLKGVR